jgi:hypothetical protein
MTSPAPQATEAERALARTLLDKQRVPEPMLFAEIAQALASVREQERARWEADYTACMKERDEAQRQLVELDGLLNEYGIDLVGTGYMPPKTEQARIARILRASEARRAAIRARKDSSHAEL